MSGDNAPVLQLFVRASALDKHNIGATPLDQQYFMAYSLLDQNRFLVLKEVVTIPTDSPPLDFVELNVGMNMLPVLRVLSGRDPKRDTDIQGAVYANDDDLEHFLSRFDCPDLMPRSPEQNKAENSFRDLYSKFNLFLKNRAADGSRLAVELSKVNNYLASKQCRYLISDKLSYADCMLMPKLHHVRVAAKAYKGFDIPVEYSHVWKYLALAYDSDIFRQSCPADQDIVHHYMTKAVDPPKGGNPQTQRDRTFSFDVPSAINRAGAAASNGP